jgi:hypothetical protein
MQTKLIAMTMIMLNYLGALPVIFHNKFWKWWNERQSLISKDLFFIKNTSTIPHAGTIEILLCDKNSVFYTRLNIFTV